MSGAGDVFDAFPVATRWAAYYEKFLAGEMEFAVWIIRDDMDLPMD